MKTGIFYGSTTGNTAAIAQQIANRIPGSETTDVATASSADLEAFDLLILGVSTWGIGDLQDDWDARLDILTSAGLDGKKVAIFGLGDQETYPDSFVDGIFDLHQAAEKAGARCIGTWPTEGYEFTGSTAVKDDIFLGLPLDEENQADLHDERIEAWIKQVMEEAA